MVSTQTATLAVDYVKTIGITTNNMGRGFINPYDVALSKDGRIFVLNHCDSARRALIRVGIMNWDEDYLGEFGSGAGSGDGQFNLPFGIAVDGSRSVFVDDFGNDRIQKFTNTGTFVTKWGSFGGGNGQFAGSIGVAVDGSGHVFVVERDNERIQKFACP